MNEESENPAPAAEAAEAPKPEKRALPPIALDPKTQALAFKDAGELMRGISIFMAGQSWPKTMDTPQKCVTAWNLAASFKNVSPQRAVSRMMYINNQLCIWGELPRALAEATGEVEDFQIFVVDKDHVKICLENKNLTADPYAAICRFKRKGRTMNEYFFTVDEAQKAGLLEKKGPWQDYAKIMLCWRAQGQGLKFEFGDALMGCEIAEYTFNNFPDLKDVTPAGRPPAKEERAEDLNSRFTSPPQAQVQ